MDLFNGHNSEITVTNPKPSSTTGSTKEGGK